MNGFDGLETQKKKKENPSAGCLLILQPSNPNPLLGLEMWDCLGLR